MHKLEKCPDSQLTCKKTYKNFKGSISVFNFVNIQKVLIGKRNGEVEIRSGSDLRLIAEF